MFALLGTGPLNKETRAIVKMRPGGVHRALQRWESDGGTVKVEKAGGKS